MEQMNTDTELDFRIKTAILTANPDGVAMIGAWDCMKTLAKSDPEGCVRLSPGLPMDIPALADYLHCSVDIVNKTLELFGQMQWLTVKDGLIRIPGCREENTPGQKAAVSADAIPAPKNGTKPALTEEALARKREKNRIRQAEYRARRKQAQGQCAGTTGKVTQAPSRNRRDCGCDRRDCGCDRCDGERDRCDAGRDTGDVGDKTASACTAAGISPGNDKCDSRRRVNTSCNRESIDIKDIEDKKDDKDIFSFSGNEAEDLAVLLSCDPHTLIPLAKLPSPFREIVEAWNGLPLKKLEGLYPAMLYKLQGLLQKYPPETLLTAIRSIGEMPFLLGKSENSTGFVISFKWFLSIPHLEKILAGRYKSYDRNRFFRNIPRQDRRTDDLPAETEKDSVSLEDMSPAERCLAVSRFHTSMITGAA